MTVTIIGHSVMIFGLVLVALASAEHSAKSVKNCGRIVNGEEADITEFPFFGALVPKRLMNEEENGLAVMCGSSLIAPRFFVTAYHCLLRNSDPMFWVIIMGVEDRCKYQGKGRVLEVSWIYKHPHAKIIPGVITRHDIALIMVNEPVTDVTPLALPLEPPRLNEIGYVFGFGLERISVPGGNDEDLACVPQKALQLVPDQETCIKPREKIVGAFCIADANNRQSTACRGDSGGPYLVVRNGIRTLLGVSSFGDQLCKSSDNSDYYTNVSKYVEWITETMRRPSHEGYDLGVYNKALFRGQPRPPESNGLQTIPYTVPFSVASSPFQYPRSRLYPTAFYSSPLGLSNALPLQQQVYIPYWWEGQGSELRWSGFPSVMGISGLRSADMYPVRNL